MYFNAFALWLNIYGPSKEITNFIIDKHMELI